MDHQAGLAPGVLTGACLLLRHWLKTEFTAGLIPAGSKPWARDPSQGRPSRQQHSWGKQSPLPLSPILKPALCSAGRGGEGGQGKGAVMIPESSDAAGLAMELVVLRVKGERQVLSPSEK